MKNHWIKKPLRAAMVCAAFGVAAIGAMAQSFPNRPVTMIVPWPPGGGSDTQLRALAHAASKHLGQPIVVENKAGASGTMGALALTSAKPDGYTITQIPLGVIRRPLIQKVNYDPKKDFSYVIGVSGYTFGLVVPASSPFKTFNDLIDYAKANPGKLMYGSAGNYTGPHLTMEEIQMNNGVQFEHVPYKGTTDLLQALLAGQLIAGVEATGWAPYVDNGKLRLLVTWGEQRTKRWPNVPTLKELGYGIVSNAPYGLAVPKGTDPKVVKVLHDAFKKGMEDPENLKMMEMFDQELMYMNTADYSRYAMEAYDKEKVMLERLGTRLKE
ncbi:tripartite tricarboxylate transporter substrate binding protein [Diaphorobacter sp. HDW4A]|uniref:tripartite tricarboxylate transporter substrate binding protein n=1 Tax=Diaphorobacter sp. HDW4A TaxID=2714924 RepID=UPI001F113CA8|nr:tripartite tricarboxylate transporter substrate binding protein [Diaphorobacter sp. HDW4A]